MRAVRVVAPLARDGVLRRASSAGEIRHVTRRLCWSHCVDRQSTRVLGDSQATRTVGARLDLNFDNQGVQNQFEPGLFDSQSKVAAFDLDKGRD